MLFSVESTDQFDNSTRSVDCTQQQFRTIQASLYQELAAENFQQTQGQRGIRSVVRDRSGRYGQRILSDNNSAHAALISNITK